MAVVVERLRLATPTGATVSAGVATRDRTESAEELLARADRALYAAKHAGRDPTVVADPAWQGGMHATVADRTVVRSSGEPRCRYEP